MVVHLRSTICLFLFVLIACPSIARAQTGFIFRDQISRDASPAVQHHQWVLPYTAQVQRQTIATKPALKPTAKKNATSRATDNSPTESTVDDYADMTGDCRDTACCDVGCCDVGCCDVGCCDVGCCDVGCCENTGCRDDGCGGCRGIGFDCCDQRDFFRSGNFYIRGWVDQGITFNSASPANRTNGPVGYNWRSNDYMMDQLYAVIGRDVCANGSFWDAGGRVDILYGTDFRYTQSQGLETHAINNTPRWNATDALYGFSLPQLYAEFAVPFAQGTTFKFGHFYSIIGYESPMAPRNFFYSHSYTKIYGEPTTETGMLASTKVSPNLMLHGGISRGWDMWENPYNTITFIGGACWTSPDDRTSVGFAIDTGDREKDKNRTILSLVISRQLAKRWTYVFQYDFGSQQDAFRNQQSQLQDANWFGIDNYLFYAISDTLSAGLRVEWFRDEDRFIVFNAAGNPALSGNDYCEITLGLNWQPNDCIIVRPELRWDWSDVKGSAQFPFRPYDDFTASHQFLFATDIIIRF